MKKMLSACGGVCYLSGIPFSNKEIKGKRIRPWVPSVDRINSNEGYTLENCRLVCAYINVAMNQFGEKFLLYVARAITKKSMERDMDMLLMDS